LVNIACVVVRYFGGTKLGVPGLIEAYGEATMDAIHANKGVEKFLTKQLRLSFSYDQMSFVERIIKQSDLYVLERNQGLSLTYTVEVLQSEYEQIRDQFEKNHHIILHTSGNSGI
jgi:putative IMPACT (imprinted ancient) family translation regulator